MASAFHTFRKRQKLFLAILGVMCMVAFLFVPQCSNPSDPSRIHGETRAASSKYGELKEVDLAQMVNARIRMNNFGQALASVVLFNFQRSLGNNALSQQMNFQMQFRQFQVQQVMQMRGLLASTGEQELVDVMLKARKAEELGLEVSDEAISELLRECTEDQVPSDQILALIRSEAQMTRPQFYNELRQVMLASKLDQLFAGGLMGSPPAERWEHYLQLKRKLTIEAAGVAVADFVSQVPDPSADLARKFFEQYKDRLPVENSPEPGFKLPHRAAFQYLRADMEKFSKAAAAEISDAEVLAYYEANKDRRYLWTDPPVTSENSAKPASEESETPAPTGDQPSTEKPSTEKPSTEKPSSEKPSSEKPSGDKPSSENKPAGDKPSSETPTSEKPADNKPSENNSGDKKPTSNQPEGNQPESTEKKPAASDQSSALRPSPAGELLLALADDTPDKTATGQPSESSASSEDTKPTDTKPTDSQPAEENPTENSAQLPVDKPQSVFDYYFEYGLPRDVRVGIKPKYTPFWRVEKDIRKQLADERANKKIDELLNLAQSRLNTYASDLALWKSTLGDDSAPKTPEPTRPDFLTLASELGLTAHETGLLSAADIARQTDLGQSNVGGRTEFVRATYGREASLLRPQISRDMLSGNRFLFWKTRDEPEHVPEFSSAEVQQEVMAAWKQQEARALARKQAEELAALARGAQKSLKDSLAGKAQVVTPAPFSWMDEGLSGAFQGGSGETKVSQVEGLTSVGNDFMSVVSHLKPNEVGVAPNQPQTVFYVVQLLNSEPLESVLRETFLAEAPRQGRTLDNMSRDELIRVSEKWVEQVRADAGLHWDRAAKDPVVTR